MNDVFISYSSDDRDVARAIAAELAQRGLSVWWDRVIPPGRQYDEVIEENLAAARCVVVLWSASSAASKWVKIEAGEALRQDRLVPALIEADVRIPLEFSRVQAADLTTWQAGKHSEAAVLGRPHHAGHTEPHCDRPRQRAAGGPRRLPGAAAAGEPAAHPLQSAAGPGWRLAHARPAQPRHEPDLRPPAQRPLAFCAELPGTERLLLNRRGSRRCDRRCAYRCAYRCAIGSTSRCGEPTNNWRGRPILYSGSPIISLSCAIHPTVRASAKMAVNRVTGMPSARCTMPE